MTDKDLNQIFVYGSLRKAFDHPKHSLLADNGRLLGIGFCQGNLYEIEWYPGVVLSDDPADRVKGEVYAIHDNLNSVLAALDQYEGYSPDSPGASLYVRRIVPVTLEDGTATEAWTYLYNRKPDELKRIPSGDFLKSRGKSG